MLRPQLKQKKEHDAMLDSLKEGCHVLITTDSNYVKDGITEWIYQWKKKDWKLFFFPLAFRPIRTRDIINNHFQNNIFILIYLEYK